MRRGVAGGRVYRADGARAALATADSSARRPWSSSARIETPHSPRCGGLPEKGAGGGREAERRGARRADAVDPGRAARLDAGDELGDPASKVPVVTFVSPAGAQAASAGFFLLLSGDVAAMAPGTNTGAAHPVGGEGQDLPKKLGEKAEQDARAFVRTLAQQRGRNVEKAEAAVSKTASRTRRRRRRRPASSRSSRATSRTCSRSSTGGKFAGRGSGSRPSRWRDSALEERAMGPMEKILGVVSHPNVAYVLFLLGPRRALLRALDARRDPSRRGRGDLAPPGPLRVLGPAR